MVIYEEIDYDNDLKECKGTNSVLSSDIGPQG